MSSVTTVRDLIRGRVSAALFDCGVSVPPGEVALEYPLELSHGDYACNAALRFAKEVGTSPRDLADRIVALLGPIEGVAECSVAGPGFINFQLSPSHFGDAIREATSSEWGRAPHHGKKVLLEYTDPNPFKELHIGHLMSNAIGESIARITEYAGAEVKRANYQGDVGLHVAKSIWGKRSQPQLSWGQAYAFGSKSYEEHKAAIDDINKKVYTREDPEINALYLDGLNSSQDQFEVMYRRLGMQKVRTQQGAEEYFDYYFYESLCWWIGKSIVEEHTPGVFTESDGAVVFKGEDIDPTLHTRVFITSQGLPTYEAKELGLFKSKSDMFGWIPDESITITASEQKDYFRVVKAAALRIPELAGIASKTRHITHGMMRLPTGKMSSRTGDVITGESLLNDLTEAARIRASESRAADKEQLAEDVAVAAIKYQILKQTSGKDIIFERDRALSLEGDSGPYVQYAHARSKQVVARAAAEGIQPIVDDSCIPAAVVRIMRRFPEVVEQAAALGEPHVVTTYVTELAAAFNSWYAQEHILDGTSAAAHKVAIAHSVHSTLGRALWLLGIPAPEQM